MGPIPVDRGGAAYRASWKLRHRPCTQADSYGPRWTADGDGHCLRISAGQSVMTAMPWEFESSTKALNRKRSPLPMTANCGLVTVRSIGGISNSVRVPVTRIPPAMKKFAPLSAFQPASRRTTHLLRSSIEGVSRHWSTPGSCCRAAEMNRCTPRGGRIHPRYTPSRANRVRCADGVPERRFSDTESAYGHRSSTTTRGPNRCPDHFAKQRRSARRKTMPMATRLAGILAARLSGRRRRPEPPSRGIHS